MTSSRKLFLSLIAAVAVMAGMIAPTGVAHAETDPYVTAYMKHSTDIAKLFDAQNAARAKAGVPKVRFSPVLSVNHSQAWAEYMAETYWWGEGYQGPKPVYGATDSVQNIALVEKLEFTPGAMAFWAEPHRERYMTQMLDPQWKVAGVGVARNADSGWGFVAINYYAGSSFKKMGVTYASGQEWLNAVAAGVDTFNPATPATTPTPKPTAPATTPATTPATVDVYSTPGNHVVNGRKWRTTCEKYSATVNRCRAEIFATQTTVVNGRYVMKNAYVFNNLTYLPSKRAQWVGNKLAKSGYFTSQGRDWNTSCNDAWTGKQACRSFIKSVVIESSLNSKGQRVFKANEKWVFNNVVRFSN